MIAIRLSRAAAWVALAAVFPLLGGCSDSPRPVASRERVFAADLVGGAKRCEAPTPALADGKPAEVAMRVSNDGGWCGVTVAQKTGRPFDSGLLTGRPANGKVVINRVGDTTRIAYTPNPGFTGSDSFSVKLIPGDATIQVAVTVTAN